MWHNLLDVHVLGAIALLVVVHYAYKYFIGVDVPKWY